MVIDAVTWFAEDEMFRLSLDMLGPLVDLFIVVKADGCCPTVVASAACNLTASGGST